MDLRFKISPSEAGTVVDGLHAQSLVAEVETRALGQETDVVRVEVDEAGMDEVREMMTILATSWSEIELGD